MFWQLLLAHFIADYPLQSNWMARNKVRWPVLSLHVAIHLVTTLLITLPASRVIWLYVVALAAIHFAIDSVKNWFTLHYPQWRAWPYVIDQVCHWLSIGLVSVWISRSAPLGGIGAGAPFISHQVAVIGIGFLLVTFVYMISERILISGKATSSGGNEAQAWSRLVARAALFGLLLAGWQMRSFPRGGTETLPAGIALLLPYSTASGGARVLLVDLLVTVVTALLVILVNGST